MTIAGVLPPGFHGLSPGETFDIAVPVSAPVAIASPKRLDNPRSWWLQMAARTPGQPGRLRDEIEAKLQAYLAAEPVADGYVPPKIRVEDGARGVHWLRQEFEKPSRLIVAVGVMVLWMAALNVAALQLARGEARAKETSARLALGAGRYRLMRQHLTESLLLTLLGTLAGFALALALQGPLVAMLSRAGQARIVDLTPDWRFFGVAAAACLMVTLLVGLYPAWRSARTDLMATLRQTQARPLPLGRLLTAMQVAISLVLLVSAAMFLRTVRNLRALPMGFDASHQLIFTADASLAGLRGDALSSLYDRAQARLSALPGVQAAAYARQGVLQGGFSSTALYYRDAGGQVKSFSGESKVHSVSPGYFEAMSIPLLAGEQFTARDTAQSEPVAVVNQAFARQLRPDGGPVVGLTIYSDEDGKQPLRIIGVVGGAVYTSLAREAPATFYMPYRQRSPRQAFFVLKVNGDPLALASAARVAMREVDPRVPVYDLRTQEQQVSLALQRERSLAQLLTGFGALALTLALVGLYGVLTYSVTRRTPEIGIRMALGAAPAALRRMVLGESLVPVLVGIATGLVTLSWFSQLAAGLVYGVEPLDPWSIGAAVAVLLAGALVAAWLPAHRASRVSPVSALRYE